MPPQLHLTCPGLPSLNANDIGRPSPAYREESALESGNSGAQVTLTVDGALYFLSFVGRE
ncbi:hypothetical protein E4U33_000703 [Claviceps sp. LM78 group G4]|nr:hypothetical protein E4U33_000703 [Claviceps sp. LM78 group G4]